MAVLFLTETARHVFWIVDAPAWIAPGAFEVQVRPLNPKTGKPWQASRRVTEGATVEAKGWEGRPQWFSTFELAKAALELKMKGMAK